MTTLREAAQQALKAMLNFPNDISDEMFESIVALKAALAQEHAGPTPGEYHGWVLREVLFDRGEPVGHREPVQEPVAWRTFDGEGGYDYRTYEDNADYAVEWAKRNPRHVGWVEPLYTAPPQRPLLADEEIEALWRKACDDWMVARDRDGPIARAFARAIERAVRGEK